MQQVKIYNDLLHLTGEWMNADMLNRGAEDRPLSLSLSLFLGGGRTSPPPPSGSATDSCYLYIITSPLFLYAPLRADTDPSMPGKPTNNWVYLNSMTMNIKMTKPYKIKSFLAKKHFQSLFFILSVFPQVK